MKEFIFSVMFFTSFLFVSSAQYLDKIDPSLLSGRSSEKLNALIVLTDQADLQFSDNLQSKEIKGRMVFRTLQTTATSSQSRLMRFLNEKGIQYRSHFIVNAISLSCTASILFELSAFKEVARIESNFSFPLQPVMSEKQAILRNVETSWGVLQILADSVWALGYKGQNVVVGGEDTGYDWSHEAIKLQYRGYDGAEADHNYNWHDAIHEIDLMHNDSIISPDNNPCGLNSIVPCDDHNHGTHTVGTMVGLTPEKVIGVAPSSKWIGCRCMERGYGKPSTYIECFEWFLAPTDLNNENPNSDLAPHVINNSWGCPPEEGCNTSNFETMRIVLDNLRMAGIFVVTSAGNDGRGGCSTVNDPSSIFDNVLSVGATNTNDSIAPFSSKGPVIIDGSKRTKPDIVAPGVGILSSIRNDRYASWQGTSMAAPHVVGTVALMISANPSLAGQVNKLEEILKTTSSPISNPLDCDLNFSYPNNTYGYGRVNALEAVKAALALATSNEFIPQENIDVSPNPFDEYVLLGPNEAAFRFSYILYDAQGKQVLDGLSSGQTRLSTVELKTGIYFLHLVSNHTFVVKKIIKQ